MFRSFWVFRNWLQQLSQAGLSSATYECQLLVQADAHSARRLTQALDLMPFSPSNLGVIICSHILEASRPILLVAHDADGWNFACGKRDHAGAKDFHVVGVGHLTSRDPSVSECADLPVGFVAERPSVGLPWTRRELSSDEA